ncbi:MAG: ARMT1-like domain-containing protein [Methanimicrococcus sp.]|nr:ARMT1-like domain-containing protein [Methanimicrococcus sp.]
MKINPGCTYCLLSRVHYQCQLSTKDPELTNKVMKACLLKLGEEYRPGRTSTHIATLVHRTCYEVLNDSDPYRYVKEGNTQTALKMLPAVRKLIYGTDENDEAHSFESSPKSAAEIFENAVLAAVIGNYFDFGIMGRESSDEEFQNKFVTFFEKGLAVDDAKEMLPLLTDVVYIADNCGEIVFDREVLDIIRKIQAERVKNNETGGRAPNITLVVRSMPILTDVTMKDVKELNMETALDAVMTTGSNAVGVCMRELPPETLTAMKNATLIISKGMANYESLSDENFGPIAFLLRTKCDAVAESLGLGKDLSVAKLVK